MPTHQPRNRGRQTGARLRSKLQPGARAAGGASKRSEKPVFEPPKLIKPHLIRRSKTPNRSSAAFSPSDPDFAGLNESIHIQKGNKLPILVRLLTTKEKGQAAHRYELIAGERRLRACRAHGLPVLAVVIKDIDPVQQVVLTMTENTGRCSLRPFELGRQVIHAMKVTGKSQNEIASVLGRNKGQVSKATAIAKLPLLLLAAFNSPRDIRYPDLPKIQKALESERRAVLTAAESVKKSKRQLTVDEVVARLTATPTRRASLPDFSQCEIPELYVAGNLIAKTRLHKGGLLEVSMKVPLSQKDQAKLLNGIQRCVARTMLKKTS